MEMVNGYVFLDLTKANVYAKALKVLGTDKPVVIKDGSGSPYFVDSLTLDGTNVVITKGGKTITIANDNTITNVGDIQLKLKTYQFELVGEDSDETAHEIRFIFNSTKTLNKDNIIEYFNNFSHSYDWSYVGEDFENTSLVIINGIENNTMYCRDIENSKDINFDLTSEDIEISLYLINEE